MFLPPDEYVCFSDTRDEVTATAATILPATSGNKLNRMGILLFPQGNSTAPQNNQSALSPEIFLRLAH